MNFHLLRRLRGTLEDVSEARRVSGFLFLALHGKRMRVQNFPTGQSTNIPNVTSTTPLTAESHNVKDFRTRSTEFGRVNGRDCISTPGFVHLSKKKRNKQKKEKKNLTLVLSSLNELKLNNILSLISYFY